MTIKDYYLAEMTAIKSRLDAYTDYGYTPELEPIVKALKKCYDSIKAEYQKINK